MKTKEYIPETLDDAINYLYDNLKDRDIHFIRYNDPIATHHYGGMALRNNWGLWKKNTPLKKDIKARFNLFGHGDDCSGLIFEGLWTKVKGKDVNAALTKAAKRYHTHWPKYGIDPVTGKEMPGFVMPTSTTFKVDKDGSIAEL
jgi:hypothetical protein